MREKLIACINKNTNDNNYEKLQKNNEILLKIFAYLKEQNDYYKNQINFQLKNNTCKINKIKNNLRNVKNKINKNLNKSQIIELKNNDYDREIYKLKTKINSCNSDNGDIDSIKSKYNIFENKINEKNNRIRELENENYNLKIRYNSINEKYQNIYLNNQNLQLKINEYENMCKRQENIRNAKSKNNINKTRYSYSYYRPNIIND